MHVVHKSSDVKYIQMGIILVNRAVQNMFMKSYPCIDLHKSGFLFYGSMKLFPVNTHSAGSQRFQRYDSVLYS